MHTSLVEWILEHRPEQEHLSIYRPLTNSPTAVGLRPVSTRCAWIARVVSGSVPTVADFYASPQTNPFVFVRDLDVGEAADKLSADKIKGVDGRQNDHYNDVFRDSRGWTWCATDDGLLLRRHGKSRMIYTEDGLCNNLIHSITEDDAHNIWVCTSFEYRASHVRR